MNVTCTALGRSLWVEGKEIPGAGVIGHENGVRLLTIPENYYDDLEARFPLPDEVIDRLKALDILYDREGDAEYFQVYTHPFEDRFFFEIVQRRGYEGFGAANAPIRLAAQSRLAASAD